MAQVVQCLSSKLKDLSSISSSRGKKRDTQPVPRALSPEVPTPVTSQLHENVDANHPAEPFQKFLSHINSATSQSVCLLKDTNYWGDLLCCSHR
jgi:hypothetical protein